MVCSRLRTSRNHTAAPPPAADNSSLSPPLACDSEAPAKTTAGLWLPELTVSPWGAQSPCRPPDFSVETGQDSSV
ncbi:unnamed protein product [Gadus morhua 'NCC']